MENKIKTTESLEKEYSHYKRFYLESDPDVWMRSMYAMAILSDAQALLDRGDKEGLNDLIDKAKYHLGIIHSDSDPRLKK